MLEMFFATCKISHSYTKLAVPAILCTGQKQFDLELGKSKKQEEKSRYAARKRRPELQQNPQTPEII